MSQIAKKKFPHAMLLGGLSVNLNHLKMKIYEPAAQIIEHALLEYEEHPEKFIPTPHATIEDNINNIPPELDITDN